MEPRERYWLIRTGSREGGEEKPQATQFVHSEVPVGDDSGVALEVFTSEEAAEAELSSMDSQEPDAYLEAVRGYGEDLVNGALENSAPDDVASLSRAELASMLDRSGVVYVLVDPTPGNLPQPQPLPVWLAWEFMERLRGA